MADPIVAALYIDPRGPYPKIACVDCWDLRRDATKYDGPWPVVAHPPCGPWGALRHLYKGGERALALVAVDQVRRWGGVLEHPAHSRLFDHCSLPRPGELPDEFGGVTVAVSQVDFGHVARKPTWLYLVGVRVPRLALPPAREPTHWVGGSRGRGRERGHIPDGLKACSAEQRRRTPLGFAEWLVELARTVRRSEVA